jgi:organic hydroperoxide reductase OsmC/OhrA
VVRWVGNLGEGTATYRSYSRNHDITAPDRDVPALPGTADVAFRGDPARYSPEDLIVAAAAGCPLLWYLHLCAENGIVVEEYDDDPTGVMMEDDSGSGEITEVTLRPRVVISAGDSVVARALHAAAHERCFIARSVTFPIRCEPTTVRHG